jgi:hypothetical protein
MRRRLFADLCCAAEGLVREHEPDVCLASGDVDGICWCVQRYHVEPTARSTLDQNHLAGFVAGEQLKMSRVHVGVVGAVRAATPEREGKHPGESPYALLGPVSIDGDRAEDLVRDEHVQHAGADGPKDPIATRGSNGGNSRQESDPEKDDAGADEEVEGHGRRLGPVRRALLEPVSHSDEPRAEHRRARKQPGDADIPALHGIQAQQRAEDEEPDFNPRRGRSSGPPGCRMP